MQELIWLREGCLEEFLNYLVTELEELVHCQVLLWQGLQLLLLIGVGTLTNLDGYPIEEDEVLYDFEGRFWFILHEILAELFQILHFLVQLYVVPNVFDGFIVVLLVLDEDL